MKYVGVDIGKLKHAASAIDEGGACVMEPRFFTQDTGGLASLCGSLEQLGGPRSVIIGMEATGHYWKVARHVLVERGYRVDVINPLITSHEAAADVRGRKSDKIDSLSIASVIRKGGYSPAPIDDPDNAALKSLTRHRRALVQRRTDAKLRLTSALDVAFPEVTKALADIFGAAALNVIKAFPSARLAAKANIRTLTSLFSKHSNHTLGREEALAYREAAQKSLSLSMFNEGEEFIIRQTIDELLYIDAQINEVEKRIKELPQPYVATLLRSIRGAGAIQPMAIAAELGDMARFSGKDMAKKILAYAGCEPRIRESGKWRGKTKISKRGSRPLRNALYVMAGTIRLHTPYFNAIYKKHTAKGKHHDVAMTHVIRKIVEVMCGMYKSDSLFISPPIESEAC